LRDWITQDLLERLFDCRHRPAKFALVIAGREIPSFHLHWSSTACEQTVLSLTELRKWERRHIQECLRVYGHDDEPQDIEAFYYFIERGYPPQKSSG